MTVQITGYLPDDEEGVFRDYAASLGIDKSALANLLIRRELARDRLGRLERFGHQVPRSACTKVTAHVDDATKRAFATHAQRHGLRPGIAAGWLFRAELAESWLLHSLGINGPDRARKFDSG